ncbi:hypothetical protein [Lentilactobacillus kisonensis]|uniref:hypothetical protein n=1 Tax=Lentilactobacillus kisonensis TaxID=481722 RepID=UPI001FB5611A|nr:hypothetical protein [Lentilactobacillus kisonensis]
MMDRPTLKKDAKSILNSHFQFYFLLWLPVFILEIIGGFLYAPDVRDGDAFTASQDIGLFITLLAAIMAIGIYYVSIDAIRQTLQYDKPLQKSFTVFARGEYFLGTILLYILIFIFTFLWSCYLSFPVSSKELLTHKPTTSIVTQLIKTNQLATLKRLPAAEN